MSVERHLRRRGAALLFRRAIPRDLHERMGQKEIVKGLGALPARRAQYFAYAMWSICEEVFTKVRQDPTLTPSDIDKMVSLYLADVRLADETARASASPAGGDAPARRRADIRDFSRLGAEIRRRAEDNDFDFETDAVEALALRAGATVEAGSIGERMAKRAMGRALGEEYIRIAHRRAEELTGPGGAATRLRLRLTCPLPAGDRPDQPSAASSRAPTAAAPETSVSVPASTASIAVAPLAQLEISGAPVAHSIATPSSTANDSFARSTTAPSTGTTAVAAPGEIKSNAELKIVSSDPPSAGSAAPTAPVVAPPARDSAPLLSVAFNDYLDRKIDVRREVRAARRPEFLSTLSTVVWIMGDRPVDRYTDADMRHFEKTFLALPRDYKNFRTKPGQTPAEVLEIAAALRADLSKVKDQDKRRILEDRLRTTTPETFNKHLSQFKSFLVDSKLPDITKGYHVAVDKSKRARRSKRQAPVAEHVEKLFQSPYWTGRDSAFRLVRPGAVIIRDAMYWAPLLCAHHGSRIEEAVQLRRKHFAVISDILCIDLSEDPSLRLKNDNAARIIPLHQGMLDLGFLEYLNRFRADDLIFPDLSNENAHGAYSASLIKRYGRYLRALFGRDIAKTLTSHCFRHFVETQLANSTLKETWINELMGHEGDRPSEADRYNKGVYVTRLKEVVDAIELPLDNQRLRKLAEASEDRRRKARATGGSPRGVASAKARGAD